MTPTQEKMLETISTFFSQKLEQFGPTPLGVDWNGKEGQLLRFQQLLQIITSKEPFSLTDLGCGYGALLDYLKDSWNDFSYQGVDISSAMISVAQKNHGSDPKSTFYQSSKPERVSDFVVASGIFNKRQDYPDDLWLKYIQNTMDSMNAFSRKGFAFNCLTKYSDKEKMRPDLYYASNSR